MDFQISGPLRMIQETVRKFVNEEMIPLENQVPEAEDIPGDIRQTLEGKAKELGLWALDTPQKYDGVGLGELGMALVSEELARTVLLPYRAKSVLGGYNGSILYQGNEEQKKKWLLPVLSGEKYAAFALTEPNAGSDAAAIKTTAVKDGDSYIINGQKMFITDADKADFLQVMVVTDKTKGHKGISCIIVEKDTPGLEITHRIDLMIPEKPCELVFTNCRVPLENLIGKEGEGFKLAQKWLTVGRMRHGSKAIGIAMRALELATTYAQERKTFGEPLANRQSIQTLLVDSAVEIHAGRLMTLHCAWKSDNNLDVRQEAAMVKYFCDEMAFQVVDRALQIFGGIGLSKELPIERLFREIRSARITEGATEIQRTVIAKTMFKGKLPKI